MVSSLDGLRALIKSGKESRKQPTTTPKGLSDHSHTVSGDSNESKRSTPENDFSLSKKMRLGSSSDNESAKRIIVDESLNDRVIIAFLRQIGQPLRLFGESDNQIVARYQNLRSRTDEEKAKGNSPPERVLIRDRPALVDSLQELALAAQNDDVLRWISTVLLRWREEISSQARASPSPKESTVSARLLEQTLEALQPLLRALASQQIEKGLRNELEMIAKCASQHRFADANKAYLQLSIGNKPWPIGVGHVFIQERASMDRIATSEHLMNNQTVRGYVQSIKRLLTKASQFWQAADSSQTSII
jgi:pre-mRNA-splicing factor 18